MEKSNYKIITDGVYEVLKSKNYKIEKFEKGEYFTDSKRAFMIDYNEDKKLIVLKTAVLQEGEGVDWREISSWLFDENSDDKDKNGIKNDFCDSVLESLGDKASVAGMKKVEMPSKKKKADTIDMESFSARFLDICPQDKEAYKKNVATYSEFLYDTFFKEYGVKAVQEVIAEGNARKTSKFFELLNTSYINGEKNVASTIVYTILCGTLYSSNPCEKEIDKQLEKFPYLATAIRNAKKILSNPKTREKYGL